ncbi:acrylyl-CoA reductase family protein [Enterococcus sp. CSURQ0835]|uniref:acrylyl-CoA reductase family protein n=1 Tax=Enterococcus sp. CSURQ0835 TaxID=2681394 RepID=UPI0013569701|nr:acryloyl-CoA reductase [Enterococcus sp. CSURQ0835]
MTTYKRFRVVADDPIRTLVEDFEQPELAAGEVLLQVAYSGINYKDALATRANTGVVRTYPITPGIDAAGTIIASQDDRFKVGQAVLVTGFGFGVAADGGWTELAVVPADWLVALPQTLSPKQAMTFGTAGFTAALAVDALEQHGLTKTSRVLVTGATGGVANFAISFLQAQGVKTIIALTRKTEQADYLKRLGATTILSPTDLPEKTKPLAKQQFDFVIDTVGGTQLSQLLPLISYGGSLALCGNAGGIKFETTVLPFILRSVNLLGIDSVEANLETRTRLWEKMATLWSVPAALQVNEIKLTELSATIADLLAGQHVGRTLIHLGGMTR